MNLPNMLTFARFIMIPAVAYFISTDRYMAAAIVYTIAGITDVLDGFIARKFNMITQWGKLADPVADKLMQITAIVSLVLKYRIPVEILFIVLIKETLMILGGTILYFRGNVVVSANWYGKLATVVFYIAIVLAIFDLPPYKDICIWIAIFAAIFALVMYFINYRRMYLIRKRKI